MKVYEYGQVCYLSMGNLVSMSVSVNVFMCRHVYVYEYDCFMYVHMCTYYSCMFVVTIWTAL